MGVDVAERAVSLGRDECGLNLRRVRLVDLWEEKERFDVVTLFELSNIYRTHWTYCFRRADLCAKGEPSCARCELG